MKCQSNTSIQRRTRANANQLAEEKTFMTTRLRRVREQTMIVATGTIVH
jgi:hypothetical protein